MFQILTSPVDAALVWRARGAVAPAALSGRQWGYRIFGGVGSTSAIVWPRPAGASAGFVAAITGAGGIPSAEAFGTPIVSTPTPGQITGAGGIASAEAFGVPTIYVTREPTVTASTYAGDSVLAGMTFTDLQAALVAAQRAYADLMTGNKVVTASYAQADGMKSVTYTKAELPMLTAFIRQLQQALGITTQARRPARFIFR